MTGGYRGLQEVTGVYNWFKSLQGVTGGYSGLQEVPGGNR